MKPITDGQSPERYQRDKGQKETSSEGKGMAAEMGGRSNTVRACKDDGRKPCTVPSQST